MEPINWLRRAARDWQQRKEEKVKTEVVTVGRRNTYISCKVFKSMSAKVQSGAGIQSRLKVQTRIKSKNYSENVMGSRMREWLTDRVEGEGRRNLLATRCQPNLGPDD